MQRKPFYFLLLVILSLSSWACGDGSIKVDPTAGNPANLVGGGTTDKTPFEFFRDDIFPIMSAASTGNGGCATSGCHLVGAAAQSAQTFFQVDPNSVDNTWNWANVRRTSISDTDYSVSNGAEGSELLQTKVSENHQAFSNWTTPQKANIGTWTQIEEEE